LDRLSLPTELLKQSLQAADLLFRFSLVDGQSALEGLRLSGFNHPRHGLKYGSFS
jgi:hypothetical protein